MRILQVGAANFEAKLQPHLLWTLDQEPNARTHRRRAAAAAAAAYPHRRRGLHNFGKAPKKLSDMSRICVKNLPKYANEDRIRDFFSRKGEITDAKLMRTKDGKSRQFAFVGFRTEQEAEEALKFYNNSYMDTCRLTCEVARKVGDPNIPRPWSRYSAKEENSSNQSKKNLVGDKSQNLQKGLPLSKNEAKNSQNSENNDPQLQEFLQVMQPRAKSKIWADDTLRTAQLDKGGKANEEGRLSKNETVRDDDISDMDYFKSRVKKEWSDSETDDEGLAGTKSQDTELESEANPSKMEEAQTHGGINHDEEDKNENPNENPMTLTRDDKNDFDTGRLFIRNLPYTANEDELLELFSQFGDVSQVHLVVDKDTKRSKGIGYVLFKLPECAVRAMEELDNSIFQGRLLHIMPAKPQKLSTEKLESDIGQDKKSFKQRREDQRKASEASGDTRAWNSFFIRPDTVVEYITRKHGISKSDLLEREADDLAVRIALGETQVVAETKRSLSSAGINVAVLEEFASKKNDNIKRSNHIILVKNLPYGSSEGDLANMFGKFGTIEKIVLPPTKALALVIFLEAAEARSAFKGLCPYMRYPVTGIQYFFLYLLMLLRNFNPLFLIDAPLYLEWAPGDILAPNQKSEQDEPSDTVYEQSSKNVSLEQTLEGILEEDIDPDRVESRSVFVKNLNFKTSDESLKKHFNNNIKSGSIKSAMVKKHVKNGKNVSMGFGFIEFDSIETATNICKDLQGTVLDGHALNLQLSRSKREGQVPKKKDKDLSSTKLLVRNVAFEATEKDLRQLFSPFGQVKSLRLPMKFGGHRGFAFVEFVTKQEAQNAFQALSSTHLYGRHLVLERAKEGESLEELRARTAAQFVDEQNGFQKLSKKRKLSIFDESDVKSARI
ncbi:uncharacterized protein A4U43_C10F2630 [Asparagus officinalis]|uniref:RRM domain-containing protein n=1 Tax=Asparagus officinalis TaxID=4686 RepID=A0A5P1E078_ASPOF|nr:uncharacterized protein A4U43_C10F2630 [Asparagus officinalis]